MAVDSVARILALANTNGEGTVDYTQLINQPSINGHLLQGNHTTEDLDIPIVKPTIRVVENSSTNYFIFSEEETGLIFTEHATKLLSNWFYWKYTPEGSGNSLSILPCTPINYFKNYSEAAVNEAFCAFYSTFDNRYYMLYKTTKGAATTNYDPPFMALKGNQTVIGTKTFNILPLSGTASAPLLPTADNQLVVKKYVDDKINELLEKLN